MATPNSYAGRNDGLSRLDRGYYRGQAYVHWTITIQDRKTGWLVPTFYYKFRELLTHAMFRYSLTCPIYCLMPDHLHLLWIGFDDRADQLNAMKFFRRQLAIPLKSLGYELQHQAYDHVLQDDERREESVENIIEYIARNPERRQLVPVDGFRDYKFTGSLIPGYPELTLWEPDYWPRFWRTYSFLRKNGSFRPYADEEPDAP
jgi:putative transposase